MLFVDQLEMLNSHVRVISKRIEELLAQHPDARVFPEFPGHGPGHRGHHAREMGEDRARFPTADVLLAETGTAPVTRSSGRSRTVRFRGSPDVSVGHFRPGSSSSSPPRVSIAMAMRASNDLDRAPSTGAPSRPPRGRLTAGVCVVHLIRASTRFVFDTDRRAVVAALKRIDTAPTVDAAETALLEFAETGLARRYPAWLADPAGRMGAVHPVPGVPWPVRKIIYTTNAIVIWS